MKKDKTVNQVLFNGDLKTISIDEQEKVVYKENDKIEEIYENTKENSGNKIRKIFSMTEEYSYKPISYRFSGKLREGQCSVCNGWFKLKTSSYWYHMNYIHGINKNNVKIPVEFRTKTTNKFLMAYCEICNDWISINTKNNNKTFGWRKHWQKFHSSSINK